MYKFSSSAERVQTFTALIVRAFPRVVRKDGTIDKRALAHVLDVSEQATRDIVKSGLVNPPLAVKLIAAANGRLPFKGIHPHIFRGRQPHKAGA